MTPHAEQIPNEAVDRQESLRVSAGLEPPYLTLPLAGRLVRDFDSVVLVLFGAVYHRRHDRAVGNRVAAKLVGDQTPRHTALPFQQFPEEALGCTPIAPGLDENVDDVPVLIDRPPEILLPTLDMHEEFVQVPRVAHARSVSLLGRGASSPDIRLVV